MHRVQHLSYDYLAVSDCVSTGLMSDPAEFGLSCSSGQPTCTQESTSLPYLHVAHGFNLLRKVIASTQYLKKQLLTCWSSVNGNQNPSKYEHQSGISALPHRCRSFYYLLVKQRNSRRRKHLKAEGRHRLNANNTRTSLRQSQKLQRTIVQLSLYKRHTKVRRRPAHTSRRGGAHAYHLLCHNHRVR